MGLTGTQGFNLMGDVGQRRVVAERRSFLRCSFSVAQRRLGGLFSRTTQFRLRPSRWNRRFGKPFPLRSNDGGFRATAWWHGFNSAERNEIRDTVRRARCGSAVQGWGVGCPQVSSAWMKASELGPFSLSILIHASRLPAASITQTM